MSVLRSLLSAAAALAMAGCTGVVVYETPGPQIRYFDGDFEYATHKGAILTELHGNPFPMPVDRFNDAVLRYMDRQNRGVPAHFTATSGERTIAPYKVVAVFNAFPSSSAEDLCRDGAGQIGPANGRSIRLAMVFCFGDDPKTEVSGKVPSVASADDPRFRELVRMVTHGLIPVQDNEEQGEGDANVN